jgi:hypothetical protein
MGTLVPALSISLGFVAFWIIVGFILASRYRKSKWPFRGRRFARLDDEEKERMEQANINKWDPGHSSSSQGRLSRFMSQRSESGP